MSDIQNDKGVNVGRNTLVDYILAGVAGIPGGLFGIAASIATLWFLAKYAGANQKWLVWALIGVIALPATFLLNTAIVGALLEQDEQPQQIEGVR